MNKFAIVAAAAALMTLAACGSKPAAEANNASNATATNATVTNAAVVDNAANAAAAPANAAPANAAAKK